MQMNKNQIVMASIGGAAVLISLILGYLVYAEGDAQDKATRSITGHTTRYRNNSHATEAQRDTLTANAEAEGAWTKKAYAALAAEDYRLYPEALSPDALVSEMQSKRGQYAQQDAAGASPLADGSPAKFINSEFMFGAYFQPYVKDGNPIRGKGKAAEVQRRWDDVCQVTDILLKNKAQSLDGLQVVEKEVVRGEEETEAEGEKAEDAFPVLVETYQFTFKATPAALVGVLNDLAAAKRFFSVDALSFAQAGDPLLAKFGASGRSEGAGGRGRRRRGAAAAEEEDADKKKVGLITDPEQELVPFTVTLTVSTLTAAQAPAQEPEEADEASTDEEEE